MRAERLVCALNWVMLLFGTAICGCKPSSNTDSQIEFKTDIQPVIEKLQGLPQPDQAKWKLETSKEARGINVPGRSWYRLSGYLHFPAGALDKLYEAYTWRPTKIDWRPKFPFALEGDSTSWVNSRPFTRATKRGIIAGQLYLCRELELIYFDLSGE
jgi:hypothetical protein